MNNCPTIQHWLPWYVSGQLSPFKRQHMAEHIAECESCQKELAGVIQLRHQFVSNAGAVPTPSERVWDAIAPDLEDQSETRIDVGSFLVGLNLGITAGRRKHPIQGDLSVLGRKVRIIGKRTKGA